LSVPAGQVCLLFLKKKKIEAPMLLY